MISSSYNNGVSQTHAYNSDNTLASITHAGAAIGNYTYNWDANKNKTAEAVSGVLSGFGFTVPASGYDGEDRLTVWNRSDNALSKAWNLSVVGDWNGVTENAQTQARTHGPTHELLSAAGQLIEHDVKGNTTKIPAILRTTDAANPQPDLNLSWDFDNRMRSASDGAVTVTYSFDALGRRVARTDSATTVVYVQNGQQTVADYVLGTAAASPTYTYTYASYIDEPVLRSGTGGDRYYHRNQQYSITALTDATGAIKERYAYTAYGTPAITDAAGTSLTTSAEDNRYTYTGREYDETLGLHHYRARMYDAVAGRFCSRDPIGYWDGSNVYRGYFVLASTDPSGLKKTCEDHTEESGDFEYDPFELLDGTAWDWFLNPLGTITTKLSHLKFKVKCSYTTCCEDGSPSISLGSCSLVGTTSGGVDLTIGNVGYEFTYEAKVMGTSAQTWEGPSPNLVGCNSAASHYTIDLAMGVKKVFVFSNTATIDTEDFKSSVHETCCCEDSPYADD